MTAPALRSFVRLALVGAAARRALPQGLDAPVGAALYFDAAF